LQDKYILGLLQETMCHDWAFIGLQSSAKHHYSWAPTVVYSK